jgi:hypothetical protein
VAEIQQPVQGTSGLLIPCSTADFGEFISGLLKTPRTISRYREAVFEVSKGDIEELYHLIYQRITEQAPSSLIKCEMYIFYENGKSVELSALQEFSRYAEIIKDNCVAIRM